MRTPTLFSIIVAGYMAVSATVFGQTTEMTGTVVAVSRSTITLKKGTDQWVIRKQPTTKITGDAKVGEEVTITYNQPDAQKKEEPLSGQPAPESK